MTAPYVLVVDDEPDIRELVKEILEDEDYRVVAAENGHAAREALREGRPDLILLDIWMPDVDGITLLKEWAEDEGQEFEHIFRQKGLPDEISSVELKWEENEMWVPKIMELSGLTGCTGEAMRLIRQGGVTVNEQKVDDPDAKLPAGTYLFKVGKRKFLRIQGNCN